MSDAELIRWAVQEIRELDEAGRSLIAGFDSMNSEEVGRLQDLEALADRMEVDDV